MDMPNLGRVVTLLQYLIAKLMQAYMPDTSQVVTMPGETL